METETKTPEQLREERHERVKKAQEKPLRVETPNQWLEKNRSGIIISKGPKGR